jgi:hypothetical protein
VLQSPEYVPAGKFGEALNTLPGRITVPFRRTAFNIFGGGLHAIQEHPALSAGYAAGGAALGSSDVDPRTAALLAPLASVYTLPFLAGAAAARARRAGTSEGMRMISGVSPISEYGIGQTAVNPLGQYYPAALRALKYLRGY